MKKEQKNSNQLAEIPKKSIYDAPNGYFEQMEKEIFEKIDRKQATKQPIAKRRYLNSWWMAAAASLLLLIVSYMFWNGQQSSNQANDYVGMLSEVPSDAIVDYLAHMDVNEAELTVYMDEQFLLDWYRNPTELLDDQEAEQELDALIEYYSL